MKNNEVQQEEKPKIVDYIVYRDVLEHYRFAVKWMSIALIVVVLLLFASNIIWLYYWNQYDYTNDTVTTTIDSQGEGIANYTGGDGGIMLGEDYRNTENNNPDAP